MGKLDEQLIQLINNEIEGKGGGFEEFCTLASEVVQPVVNKVFPKNETLYKKAVKQILVRMYQKIEMADMNQIREWMERFALDVLEKNYPRETAAAKKRETRQEQEPVKNEESLQKSARTEEQEQDELIAAAMAIAFLCSLCSTSDAVIAASMTGVLPASAMLVFLLFGPMLDLKNTLMMVTECRPRFIIRFVVTVAAVCFPVAVAIHLTTGA